MFAGVNKTRMTHSQSYLARDCIENISPVSAFSEVPQWRQFKMTLAGNQLKTFLWEN